MVQSYIWFKDDPSQFSIGQTAESNLFHHGELEKPHRVLDGCSRILLSCFRARAPEEEATAEETDKTRSFARSLLRCFVISRSSPVSKIDNLGGLRRATAYFGGNLADDVGESQNLGIKHLR